MQTFTKSDYKLFERIVSLTQKELYHAMLGFLKAKYNESVIITKEYIVAVGDLPIALVAHMDTVFSTPVTDLYYDQRKATLWSPQGLGADDRAGIFAILKIIRDGYRPSVILTTDEELGGIGASELAKLPCPIPNLKYMIELDRRGTNDCVFYDCYNPDFISYVESFGFCEQWGSFSDISFLMGAWDVCGVNLSIGYQDEHSIAETLHVKPMYDTIAKVKKMLEERDIPDFKYDELVSGYSSWWTKQVIYGQHCGKCKGLFSEYELFPVKGLDGKVKFYCPDCVSTSAWCDSCGEAFEVEAIDPHSVRKCKDCEDDKCTKTSKANSKK